MIIQKKSSVFPLEDGNLEDEKGFIIYRATKGKRFNLPAGRYNENFDYKILAPINYMPHSLPSYEKNGNKKIKSVSFKPNIIGTANINAKQGIITLDDSLLNGPKVVLDFILLHEIGHFFYFTEWKCDHFAISGMIKKGWNPSQIRASSMIIRNKRRKEIIRENLRDFEI